MNAQRKADILRLITQLEKIHPEQSVAVGDGANDLLMMEASGFGIAYNVLFVSNIRQNRKFRSKLKGESIYQA